MNSERTHHDPAHQAFVLLRIIFVVAPILAGLDKFFGMMTNWDMYLSPYAANMIGGHTHAFMIAVGVIEIIVGLGVAFKPRVFSYIVSLWLALIIANLVMLGAFYDIALRDFGLFLAAIAFARLCKVYCHSHKHGAGHSHSHSH